LLVGAGLFLQSLNKLENTDLKLDAKNRYILHVNPQERYSPAQIETLYRTMEERFHAIPGVLKVGIASYTPMEDNNNSWGMQIQGKPYAHTGGSWLHANAEYFDSVGTKVLMGRGITVQDTATAPKVAVVNETFVKKLFAPGENPIGHHFGYPGPVSSGDFEIVGVVEDTVYTSVHLKDHLMAFMPPMQRPPSAKESADQDEDLYSGAIVLQVDRPRNDMEALVQRTLAAINPNLTVTEFQTFSEQIAEQFTQERTLARLTTLFGVLALLLASLGLYGVTSYSVVRRTPEIGIRMALGAERGGVIAMIMRGALFQTISGLAIGVPIALLCVRFVKAELYEITSVNAGVMTGAILTLAVAACIAAIIPARRAASTNPVQALRME
jgi:macrolide transport system ATP-binding/permease protein